MRCALVFICIIIALHLIIITLICTKLLSISSYISNITIKMYFFDCIQRGGVAYGDVKRGTVRFVFGTRSNFPPPPHTFLILNFFIRCLLVEVREGLEFHSNFDHQLSTVNNDGPILQ
jgi:hypothetical protein